MNITDISSVSKKINEELEYSVLVQILGWGLREGSYDNYEFFKPNQSGF